MIENCPMRHENGNCIPAGGFCTANKNICEALLNAYRMGKEQLSKESTTSDLISRTAAIDAAEKIIERDTSGNNAVVNAMIAWSEYIRALPPAQPEPHEGHWIKHIDPFDGEQYECSECGVLWEFNDGTPEDNEAYFCPKCGTKMKGVRHETD
jgi:DNA-directed RNA polymerase subunit RPC12/RpoP